MLQNKQGWIRVVEAFVAVLLIGGVIILILSQNNDKNKEDISAGVYDDELIMLRAVQLNDTLRASVLGISDSSLPLSMNDSDFPQNVKTKLEEKNPGYLACDAKICKINEECIVTNTASKDIYVSQATIFANFQKYSPRKLAISCSLK